MASSLLHFYVTLTASASVHDFTTLKIQRTVGRAFRTVAWNGVCLGLFENSSIPMSRHMVMFCILAISFACHPGTVRKELGLARYVSLET